MTDPRQHTRRALMAGMDDAKTALKERLDEFTHIWQAASPATHLGDTYTLTVANVSGVDRQLVLPTTIMDHREHDDASVGVADLTLAAGESSVLKASNGYGVANHFQTTVLANTGLVTNIELLVVVESRATRLHLRHP